MRTPRLRVRPALFVLLLGGLAPVACILSPIEDLPVDGGGSDLDGGSDGDMSGSGGSATGTGGSGEDVDLDVGGGGNAGAGGDEP